MEKTSIPLQFDLNGTQYTGWATPSDQKVGRYAKSYHVVLNQVFFGNLSHDRGKWLIDENRPNDLVMAAGECLNEIITSPGTDETSSKATIDRGNKAIDAEQKANNKETNDPAEKKTQAEDAENWRNEG